MQRFCLGVQLRSDPALVEEYVRLHQQVWPEVRRSIRDAGVLDMQIYRFGRTLFMIMETDDTFTLERKAALDAGNEKVMEWEAYMARFQEVGEEQDLSRKWTPLEKIFQLE